MLTSSTPGVTSTSDRSACPQFGTNHKPEPDQRQSPARNRHGHSSQVAHDYTTYGRRELVASGEINRTKKGRLAHHPSQGYAHTNVGCVSPEWRGTIRRSTTLVRVRNPCTQATIPASPLSSTFVPQHTHTHTHFPPVFFKEIRAYRRRWRCFLAATDPRSASTCNH